MLRCARYADMLDGACRFDAVHLPRFRYAHIRSTLTTIWAIADDIDMADVDAAHDAVFAALLRATPSFILTFFKRHVTRAMPLRHAAIFCCHYF